MLNFEELVVACRKKIEQECNTAGTSRFTKLGDHDYIVGRVSAFEEIIQMILEIQKRKERMEDVDF